MAKPLCHKAPCTELETFVQLVVATGKAPGGEWVGRTVPKLGPAPQPGVFMQGAVVKGPDGSVIYTRELPRHIIETVVAFGQEHGGLLLFYRQSYHSDSGFHTVLLAILLCETGATATRPFSGKSGLTPVVCLEIMSICADFQDCHDIRLSVQCFDDITGVQVTAYCTDRILSERTDEQSDRLIFYGEPTPETVGPLLAYTKDLPIQKMLLMADKAVTDRLRPHLQEALKGEAEITVAIQGMLEVTVLSSHSDECQFLAHLKFAMGA